jgi:hypothetical protein
MKPIHFQIGITLDGGAVTVLVDLVQQAIEEETARLVSPKVSAAANNEQKPQREPMTSLERSNARSGAGESLPP